MFADAEDILTRMAAVYAALRTYRDTGVVTTTFFSPRKRTRRRPFSTRFARSRGFLFEFRSRHGEDDWDQFALWTEGGRVRSWWSIKPEREGFATLANGLSAATGTSGGASHRVPHLLMPEMHAHLPSRPREPASVVDDADASAQDCVVVALPRMLGLPEHLWIDRSTLLIRRVVEPRHVPGPPPPGALERLRAHDPRHAEEIARRFAERPDYGMVEVESVTTYEAEANPAIDSAELLFSPGRVS
ncbi:MAG TPA: hypothetical protein VHC70_10295 [Phycisphaerales bacterium]|nr:hypothetical protein [Phycisphaerales bacterium]